MLQQKVSPFYKRFNISSENLKLKSKEPSTNLLCHITVRNIPVSVDMILTISLTDVFIYIGL